MTREQRNAYARECYVRRKELLLDALGRQCASCGSSDGIEFDHVDPSTKSFGVLENWSLSLDTLLAEVAKCQPLCAACHLAKSTAQQPLTHGWRPYRHGSQAMYARQGCRCGLCRLQKKNRNKRYRDSKKEPSMF